LCSFVQIWVFYDSTNDKKVVNCLCARFRETSPDEL
jgi:hypothetical protein